MQARRLHKFDVVQIDPQRPTFGGCFVVVTEPKPWGAKGYVTLPGKPGATTVVVHFDDIEPVGIAPWGRA